MTNLPQLQKSLDNTILAYQRGKHSHHQAACTYLVQRSLAGDPGERQYP